MNFQIQLLIIIQLFITCMLPTSGSYFSLINVVVFFAISSASLYYLFMYYYTLPIHKQSILIFLTRMLIVVHGIQLLFRLAIEIILQCFKQEITDIIDNNFDVMCYIMKIYNPGLLWLTVMLEIIAFKTLLTRSPVLYLKLNTWITKLICTLILIVFFIATRFLLKCNKRVSELVLNYFSINLENADKVICYSSHYGRVSFVAFVAFLLICIEIFNNFTELTQLLVSFCSKIKKLFSQFQICVNKHPIQVEQKAYDLELQLEESTQNTTSDQTIGFTIDLFKELPFYINNDDINSSTDIIGKKSTFGLPSKKKIPISYRFVLLMITVLCVNIVLHVLNEAVIKSSMLMWIQLTTYRLMHLNAPFVWLMSHPDAKKFAANRMRQNVVNITC